MNITIVHNSITADDGPDAMDVLAQVEAVDKALLKLGHRVKILDCSLNLDQITAELQETTTELVFNLVESLGGHGRLIHLFPALLEVLRIPCTGSSSAAIALTSNKTAAKDMLRNTGLPTPDWVAGEEKINGSVDGNTTWIIKSLWEHASLGMDADSLVQPASAEELFTILGEKSGGLGGACFAEHFIEGREFNISLLAGTDGPEVLPPAEILFENFSTGMARIVDYSAKWDDSSFSYHHTPRSFEFSSEDAVLLANLKEIAGKCWLLFKLNGYARVDFRVGPDGRPWILEVNANPCLSPDAGFAAALEKAGLSFSEAIRRIINDASPGSFKGAF
ncbi:MAG: D-alanine--D-alanine ligase [Desulfocapsa sp.]|nr:D-alanine--D-alanine ligase [Desulfocapsa sp.]